MSRAAAHREPLIDALRAAAILGVLVVNVHAYVGGPWGSPLGRVVPADSPLASLAQGLVAWLFQGKAYPLLAFLFGYGQALGLGRHDHDAIARRRLRMRRLLVLGVLHGALLYAGDILTLYALCGMLLLAQARSTTRALRSRLLAWLLLSLVMLGLSWWLVGPSTPAVSARSYPMVDGVAPFLALNAGAYVVALLGSLMLFSAEVMTLMTAGFIAGRLRLFSHRRWQPLLSRTARWLLPAGLALNAVYALVAMRENAGEGAQSWAGFIGPLGWCLAAGYAVSLASLWHAGPPRWLHGIAALGRYTLSLYVGLSLLCALLLSGAGLGAKPGNMALLGAALGLWVAAVGVARWASVRRLRGPLEAWMARP